MDEMRVHHLNFNLFGRIGNVKRFCPDQSRQQRTFFLDEQPEAGGGRSVQQAEVHWEGSCGDQRGLFGLFPVFPSQERENNNAAAAISFAVSSCLFPFLGGSLTTFDPMGRPDPPFLSTP